MHRVAALSAARHVTRHDSRNGVAAGPSAAAAAAAASLRPAAIGAMPLPLSRDMIEKLARQSTDSNGSSCRVTGELCSIAP